MSAKVSQFEATVAKFFYLLSLHYEHLLCHAFDKHWKYHYKNKCTQIQAVILLHKCVIFRNTYITSEPKQFLKISLRGVIQ